MNTDDRIRHTILLSFALEPSLNKAITFVGVHHGRVELSGEVSSEAERATAERLARNTDGVISLSNGLILTADASRRTVDDAQLEAAARYALNWAAPANASTVRTTTWHGWLTLEGVVDSEKQKLAVENALRYLFGLRGLANHLHVKNGTHAALSK